jgi:hypothetical protein
MCRNVGAEVPTPAPAEAVECVRGIIAKHARHDLSAAKPSAGDCTTDIDASLLEAWRKAAMDPDTAVCQWLLTGAPAGLHKLMICQKLLILVLDLFIFLVVYLFCLRYQILKNQNCDKSYSHASAFPAPEIWS